ncbi:glycosyltransferase 87 family protein [Bradyrhizobium sp. Arg237L]|uniref:glycosyltransferase 87 family protein n=1 Tax=Bradyrhizobium sp. Arg237L TaxID=3003352 RepID=UPI00249ED394|nr:glycosyltransferase 87 family protein [Bradyrhizobium sp. Arg237L]MDI4232041.1 glycosyltransferase 87 family protein [Bradyrhizobium sp. Arg237L]
MPGAIAVQLGRLMRSANNLPPLHLLAGIGTLLGVLTLVTPFAFQSYGDNAFIALTIAAGLLTIVATCLVERAPPDRALWLIFGLGIALRVYALLFDPLLSGDIYRYVWDGKVQAAGINPYRYMPADEALAFLRDGKIFPHINRADTAVSIYPPVAQFFFLIVTRFGESVIVMRLALLGCEAIIVTMIMLLLRRMNRPLTRVVAYLWHPLPLWEIANSGHVDALMVALMLLGLWIALTGHALRGAVLIAFSMLVKPYVAPVLAGIWRPWNLKMPLVVIATVALCYLPYLSVGWGVLGFLTKGYLTEEGISAGNDLWLLSLWRLVFGEHQGDVVAYVVLAALVLVFKGLSVARSSDRTVASRLADINMLLLITLLLLSPNYPWYFLIVAPFAALCGSAPTWVVSIGALLLSEQLDWDFYIPRMVTKSILFGGLLLALAVTALRTRMQRIAEEGESR